MNIEIEDFRRESNVPLYLQVMEIIKYQIATGNIEEGEKLPSIRSLADKWGIHMHTIRHAYKELEKLDLIVVKRPVGAVVSTNSPKKRLQNSEEISSFINKTVGDAKGRFNLSPEELVILIEQGTGTNNLSSKKTTYFIECNSSQIEDHIKEIESVWDTKILPLPLNHKGALPEGNLISTYFHYSDIRSQWPTQFHNVTFVSISPSLQIRKQIDRYFQTEGKGVVTVCDQSEEQSLAIHADLKQIFPQNSYEIKTSIVKDANQLVNSSENREPLLFTPRVWAQLTEEEKKMPHVFKVVYQLNRKNLNHLGNINRWNRVSQK